MANGGSLEELNIYFGKNVERTPKMAKRFQAIQTLVDNVCKTPLSQTLNVCCSDDSVIDRLELLCMLFDYSRKGKKKGRDDHAANLYAGSRISCAGNLLHTSAQFGCAGKCGYCAANTAGTGISSGQFAGRRTEGLCAEKAGRKPDSGYSGQYKGFGQPDRFGRILFTRCPAGDAAAAAYQSHSASADDGGKFDVAHMAAGSQLSFELTWLGTEQTEAETKDVEQLLSALNSELILLGGQKSNGFGRVELTVTRQRYNLMDDTDRTSWLERKFNGKSVCLSAIQPENIVTFILHGQADRILVKDSAPVHEKGGSVTVNLTENGQPILPGSSIKGAVRGQVKRIAGYLGIGDERVNALFGRKAQKNDQGVAGRVRFEDVSLSPYKQKISRIRINRFTGGVMNTGLFNEEPLCSKLTLKITAPADDSVGCGLLVYALRTWGAECTISEAVMQSVRAI